MRWAVFAIVVYGLLVVQEGLAPLWAIGEQAPNLLLILTAFVVLRSPPGQGRWLALLLGALVDLTTSLPVGSDRTVMLLGPMALGFFAAALVVQELRKLLYRDSPLALAILVFAGGVFAHLVAVALLTARGLAFLHTDPIAGWNAPDQLVSRFWDLLYTTAVALPLGLLLARIDATWPFCPGAPAARSRRPA